MKLHTVRTPDGKLTPDLIDTPGVGFGDVHRSQPRVVSITNATELGTVYTPGEIAAITEHAHARGMLVARRRGPAVQRRRRARRAAAGAHHRRGGRRGVVRRHQDRPAVGRGRGGAEPRGGARAAVHPEDEHAARLEDAVRVGPVRGAARRRPVAAQRPQRQRDGAAAGRTRRGEIPHVTLSRAPQANAVFATLPDAVADRVRKDYPFYTWNQETGEVRWMCAYDTTEEDVDAFVAAHRRAIDNCPGAVTGRDRRRQPADARGRGARALPRSRSGGRGRVRRPRRAARRRRGAPARRRRDRRADAADVDRRGHPGRHETARRIARDGRRGAVAQYAEPSYATMLLAGGSAGRAYLLKERVGEPASSSRRSARWRAAGR